MPREIGQDPTGAFQFGVEMLGTQVAGFSEVSGIGMETELEEYREGGVNDHCHYFPKGTKYSKLVLKRGVIGANDLWSWYRGCVSGAIKRKTISIILYDYSRTEVRRWSVVDAFPVKWVGPDLKSDSNAVAVESIELVHRGITVIKGS